MVNRNSDKLQKISDIFSVCLMNVLYSERLKRASITDGLTGTNNRRFFDQRFYEEISYSQRTKQPLTCLFFDVDHFKKVNDTYGHQAGDIVLRKIANIIRRHLRVNDVLARYGGEEFAALLINTSSNAAYEIAERTRECISQYDFIPSFGGPISVTISIGMATLHPPAPEDDPEEVGVGLLRQADVSLYRAKSNGRNCVSNHSIHKLTAVSA